MALSFFKTRQVDQQLFFFQDFSTNSMLKGWETSESCFGSAGETEIHVTDPYTYIYQWKQEGISENTT